MAKAKTTTKSKSRGRMRAKATTGARQPRKAAKQPAVRARRGQSGSPAAEGRNGGRPEQQLPDE
jgi:hypothetical protein